MSSRFRSRGDLWPYVEATLTVPDAEVLVRVAHEFARSRPHRTAADWPDELFLAEFEEPVAHVAFYDVACDIVSVLVLGTCDVDYESSEEQERAGSTYDPPGFLDRAAGALLAHAGASLQLHLEKRVDCNTGRQLRDRPMPGTPSVLDAVIAALTDGAQRQGNPVAARLLADLTAAAAQLAPTDPSPVEFALAAAAAQIKHERSCFGELFWHPADAHVMWVADPDDHDPAKGHTSKEQIVAWLSAVHGVARVSITDDGEPYVTGRDRAGWLYIPFETP